MSKKKNSIWSFFASVKLALFVLFFLALASIIGTVIPQNSPEQAYIDQYGPNMAKLFQLLDFPDMYDSWWFVTLLCLLALNLTVCTIERLPNVWQIMTMNNLDTAPKKLTKMRPRKEISTSKAQEDAAAQVRKTLQDNGWKATETTLDDGVLLFAQKGPWTRLGVYIVHTSILIIFAGAMIGSHFGYKGSVMIPETSSTDKIYEFDTAKPIDLGFTVRCNKFTLSHYPNGAPKEFRSELDIIEDGKVIVSKSIIVNDPLSHKGHTFYQSSYQSYKKFITTITNNRNMQSELFLMEPGKEFKWHEANVSVGIINRNMTETPRQFKYKIFLSDATGKAETFWIVDGDTTTVKTPGNEYTFSIKEFYATGLQVTKDPGVWYVYFGCIVMLLGLMIAFFLSHQRIWIYIRQEEETTRVLVSGTSNKNKPAFEKKFNAVSLNLDEKLK